MALKRLYSVQFLNVAVYSVKNCMPYGLVCDDFGALNWSEFARGRF